MGKHTLYYLILLLILQGCSPKEQPRNPDDKIRAIAFFTAKQDPAHISFVHEANDWFARMAPLNDFTYDTTSRWSNLNESFLKHYDVVLFLDTRPEDSVQRVAFEQYMQHGGGWMGFHFAAFALTQSDYPQNWPWYHEEFLGSGEYNGNTWRPTSATLRVDNTDHPITKNLNTTFTAPPNEWYRWRNDLTKNKDIDILVSIDSSGFPLGTGPKPHEIWYDGYYPVVWTNRKYRMVYFNMGHNDMDYEGGTNRTLSSTFSSESQNGMIIEALKWVGEGHIDFRRH